MSYFKFWMKPVQMRQKKIADLAVGDILDVGYEDHPNPYLKGNVVGLDLNKGRIAANYKKIYQGDAQNIDKIFKAKSFDTIIAAEIIEHIENSAQFLRGARAILKKKGVLILSTPNPYHLPTMLVNMFFLRPPYTAHVTNDPYHINLFPYRNMVTLLEHCDFELLEVINANGLILNPKIDIGPVIPFPKALSQGYIYVAKKSKKLK